LPLLDPTIVTGIIVTTPLVYCKTFSDKKLVILLQLRDLNSLSRLLRISLRRTVCSFVCVVLLVALMETITHRLLS
jgi:hypothetical protein